MEFPGKSLSRNAGPENATREQEDELRRWCSWQFQPSGLSSKQELDNGNSHGLPDQREKTRRRQRQVTGCARRTA